MARSSLAGTSRSCLSQLLGGSFDGGSSMAASLSAAAAPSLVADASTAVQLPSSQVVLDAAPSLCDGQLLLAVETESGATDAGITADAAAVTSNDDDDASSAPAGYVSQNSSRAQSPVASSASSSSAAVAVSDLDPLITDPGSATACARDERWWELTAVTPLSAGSSSPLSSASAAAVELELQASQTSVDLPADAPIEQEGSEALHLAQVQQEEDEFEQYPLPMGHSEMAPSAYAADLLIPGIDGEDAHQREPVTSSAGAAAPVSLCANDAECAQPLQETLQLDLSASCDIKDESGTDAPACSPDVVVAVLAIEPAEVDVEVDLPPTLDIISPLSSGITAMAGGGAIAEATEAHRAMDGGGAMTSARQLDSLQSSGDGGVLAVPAYLISTATSSTAAAAVSFTTADEGAAGERPISLARPMEQLSPAEAASNLTATVAAALAALSVSGTTQHERQLLLSSLESAVTAIQSALVAANCSNGLEAPSEAETAVLADADTGTPLRASPLQAELCTNIEAAVLLDQSDASTSCQPAYLLVTQSQDEQETILAPLLSAGNTRVAAASSTAAHDSPTAAADAASSALPRDAITSEGEDAATLSSRNQQSHCALTPGTRCVQ